MTLSLLRTLSLSALVIAAPAFAWRAHAQTPDAKAQDAPAAASDEIELNLINLPTTLPLKRHQSYFRLTHRFARDVALAAPLRARNGRQPFFQFRIQPDAEHPSLSV